jgi:hypothetical protein
MKATTAKPVRAPINMLKISNTCCSLSARRETHQRSDVFRHETTG